jgi:sugar (pentulose or hexulose) kinase
VAPEPSLGVSGPRLQWHPSEPKEAGRRFRAALEALAYLIARGVREHEQAGQKITRITVSGGIARSPLMCEILASVLERPLERLQSEEGPALGAAVTGLASLENHLRKRMGIETPFPLTDAVALLVKYREPVTPNPSWQEAYRKGLAAFEERLNEKPAVARPRSQPKPKVTIRTRVGAKARAVGSIKKVTKVKKKAVVVAGRRTGKKKKSRR